MRRRSNGIVARFWTEYQRDLWIRIDPDDRKKIGPNHPSVALVKKWVATSQDFDEGVVAP